MQITILLFASYQDAAGTGTLLLSLPGGARVADCAAALGSKFPELGARLAGGRVAVNAEFADNGVALSDGDEVAFLPPMSGG